MDKAMTEPQQFLDILTGYLHMSFKINSKATYRQCQSHQLHLDIGASFNNQCVRNAFDKVKEISYFFKFSSVEDVKKFN